MIPAVQPGCNSTSRRIEFVTTWSNIALTTGRELTLAEREQARALLLERFGSHVIAADWHRLIVQASAGEPCEITLDDPVDSSALLRILASTSGRESCLKRLISEGFAKHDAFVVACLL